MPKRTAKGADDSAKKMVFKYKRLIKAGIIDHTKANAKIPPLNKGHKMHFGKLLKNPTVKLLADKPSQCVVFNLEDADRVRAEAAQMGLDRYIVGTTFVVPAPPFKRVYFNEKNLTLTICDDKTGEKVVVVFADWDKLIMVGAIPDIKYTKKLDGELLRDEDGNIIRSASSIAVFNPNTCRTMSDRFSRTAFIKTGYRYKIDVIDKTGIGKTGLAFIQTSEIKPKWTSAKQKHVDDLPRIFSTRSDFRRR